MNIEPILVPKPGIETSSFKIALISVLMPVLALVIVIVALVFVKNDKVRDVLISALQTVVLPAVLAAGAIGWKYIDRRGDVSVAKVEALATIEVEKVSANLPTNSAIVGDNLVQVGGE